ncbi:hypothetical protein CERSUDRAFT_65472 [Gelatoporia subvermispora B]|uniref:DNA ligase n=1 Tax=Ceriporiopsis subvermispora (strain B) TaxID=914234 RepID=M2RGH7_CERS8|nr:hypothetical protein CERSUDRAFT_65472 [Gelatoporia subvermispora B]
MISADEELAWKLAQEDGLDLKTLQKLEAGGSRGLASGKQTARSEVIDVDLLDNQVDDAGLSKAPVNSPVIIPRPAVRRSPSVRSQPPASRSTLGDNYSPDPPAYRELAVDPPSYTPGFDDWPSAKPVPYSFLAHALASLTETRSRIAIVNILTNTLRSIISCDPPSLLPALYLLSNSLSPPYSPVELGLGPSVISKAIQHVSGLTPAALKRLYNRTGDPGDVAFEAKSNVRTLVPHPPLLVPGVYDALLRIANAKGQGAVKQKQAVVEKLLVAAKGEEIRFLVRTLCQNLRVGAVRTTLLTALARAIVLTPPRGIPHDTIVSRYHVTQEVLERVKPLVTDSKKKVADPARVQVVEAFQTAEALLKEVYVRHPNYDNIVKALLEVGLDGLAECLPLTIGVPLLPTLGSPTRSLDEIYDRLGLLPFTAEFKYDGQRAQIHAHSLDGASSCIKIFSRHLEDMTDKYPDVVSLVEHILDESADTVSFIIDAEVVAVDPIDGSLRSFQELSNRARKDVKLDDVKVSVGVFAFDMMYLNGQVLLDRPFRERRALLRNHFPARPPDERGAAQFCHVASCESEAGRQAVEQFWQMALNSASEGLMIKLLDSGDVLEEPSQRKDHPRRKPLPATYEPDKRTSAWLKLKRDYVTGLGDSLDLVPVGAWHGNGRKAQWWSPILLAVWDPAAGQLVAVCKCMSGFTDAFYKDLRERYPLDSDTCSRQPLWDPVCDTGGLKPEVYFKPQEVWEIRGADVTISPVSVAALGLVSSTRGLSLRFPRFIRIREDKGLENASTPEFLAKMWRDQQANGKDQAGADEGELLDAEILSEEDEDDELDRDDTHNAAAVPDE